MPQSLNPQVPSAGAVNPYPVRSLALIGMAVFAFALNLRFAAIAIVGVDSNGPNFWSESGTIAQNLFNGQGYTYAFYGLRKLQPLQSFMPPLFIWLLYACLRFSTQPALTLALVHAVLSSLTAVAIFMLAAQLSQRRAVALLSGLAAAGYPVMVLMITIPISLTLHLACWLSTCLLYTSPSPRDGLLSRMPSSA